jgi:multidrug resistance efflux pump
MPTNNGTQTIGTDERQTVAVVDHDAPGSPSKETPGAHATPPLKRILAISAAIVAVIAGSYFVWNALQYEDTDDAQINGHVIRLSARINGQIKDVFVSEGHLVHAGDALVTIDPQDYKIAEELAQVNVSEGLFRAASSHRNVSAHAEVSRRYLQLAQAELNLSHTVICSPVTGIVGKTRVEVGQNVNIGLELVDVVPLDDVWVTANFKETQIAHMRPGQPVEVKVDAYGRKWNGHVTNLGGGTDSVFSLLPLENSTGDYKKVVQRLPVRIDFDRTTGQEFNAQGWLKPGLSVEPKVRVRYSLLTSSRP